MAEQYQPAYAAPDLSGKIRDLEEKIRLLKDRVLMLGQSLVEERETNIKDIQELKKTAIRITEENKRLKELMERVTEQLNNSSRKEDIMILQRQLDLIRK